jgi:DNA-binding FadR family transcriptional regulator
MAGAIRRHPLAEQAAEVILARIGSGEWPLGHKLPGETALAAELGVGRSTVREAVRELAGRGVLESRQGAGVFVVATDSSQDWETVLRRADIDEVVEGRIAIEAEAARLAAQRRTPADLRAIAALLDARAVAAREARDEDYVDADIAFHQAVVAAAHNTVLAELFQSFVPRVRRAMIDMLRFAGDADDHRTDHGAHLAIADAVRAGDPEAAARSSRHQLARLRRPPVPQHRP